MSDTCWLNISLLERDLEEFEAAINEMVPGWGGTIWNNLFTGGGKCFGDIDEVNYRFEEELQALAEKGFVFSGGHGAGSSYGPRDFVAMGGEVRYICCNSNGDYVVTINPRTAEAYEHDLEDCRAYTRMQQNVEDYFQSKLGRP